MGFRDRNSYSPCVHGGSNSQVLKLPFARPESERVMRRRVASRFLGTSRAPVVHPGSRPSGSRP